MVATQLKTASDLFQMDSNLGEFELVRGELVAMSPASGDHGIVGLEIAGQIWSYLKTNPVGRGFMAETGFIVSRDPDTVLSPDVSFVMAERLTANRRFSRFVPFAPDLAVEIESPSNREGELLAKVALYLAGGTRLVWLIRPLHSTVTVFKPGEPELVLRASDTLDGGSVLPGFSLPLSGLFEALEDALPDIEN